MLRAWLEGHRKDKSKPGKQVSLSIERGGKPLSLTATLIRKPLSLISPEFQLQTDGTLYEHQHAFLLSLEQLGKTAPKRGEAEIGSLTSLREQHWQGKKIKAAGAEGIEFSMTLPRIGKGENATGLEIIKRYWLKPRASLEDDGAEAASPGFDFTLELEFRNTGDTPTQLAYRLDGPTGLPKEGWWYSNKIHPRHFFNALGARDVIWSSPTTGSLYMGTTAIVKQAEDDDSPELKTLFAPPQPAPFRYAGIDAQYFSCVMLPTETDPDQQSEFAPVLLNNAYAFPVTDLELLRDDKGRFKKSNVTFRLNSAVHDLGANESFKQQFTVFAGPKDPEILAQYELDDIISYGWFGIISKPLLKLLHGLYWITGSFSYGLAIILLTLIVRSCLMPLGLKAARSAKKMQELAPEIKKLKEKYPDNLEKQWAAQQELLKKNNASQFGGCLPMFLQLPIFLGLYRGLATDIQLRQAPLLPGVDWCTNLAGPDKLFYWKPYLWESLGGEMGWLGPYFNLLPVITVVLFYLHQKLFTPPATDDQQKQMQQVMSFMMIFFCVMFFKVPAGLCLYFITSSLWGLGERLFLKKDAKTNESTDLAMPAANQAKLAKAKEEKVERRKELARKQQKKR
jgi:YidC/Oxa1 family membrane protein insertase